MFLLSCVTFYLRGSFAIPAWTVCKLTRLDGRTQNHTTTYHITPQPVTSMSIKMELSLAGQETLVRYEMHGVM